ncbi:MAG: DoxX family membrane protein [Verrucomicrobiia bacterium]
MQKLYRLWVAVVSKLQSPFLLIIRLYWGRQFFLTGRGKLMNLDRTANFFANLHIPMPKLNAVLAGSTECFGGLLLLLGLGSRIDKINGIFSNPDAFLSAAPFQFMLTAIIILIFGPGIFSLDALIARIRGSKEA